MIKTKVGCACWRIGVDEQKGSMQCSIYKRSVENMWQRNILRPFIIKQTVFWPWELLQWWGKGTENSRRMQLMWICIIEVRNNPLFWLCLSSLSHVSFTLWWYRISHVPWIYCIPLDSIFFVNVTSSVWSLLFYSKKFLLNLHDPVFWLPLSC